MIVLGGTYEEVCRDPASNDLIGSGQRAAAVLRSVVADGELELITAVDDDNLLSAETLALGGEVPITARRRSEAVKFSYSTPLSAPIISGTKAEVDGEIEADTDIALAFGMLEAKVKVRAARLVFDPQQPKDLTPLALETISADHLALVANAAETRALAGGARSFEEAATELLRKTGAEVLVTKAGSRGALVTTQEAQQWIGPHPTREVWPIGSGDVFAAGFAWAWGQEEATPLEAAKAGSIAAAHWCASQRLNLPPEAFTTSPSFELAPLEGRVYLAGPFFNIAERWLIELANESMRSLGGFVFSPLHDVGRGHDVAAEDIAGLEDSTAVLALLDHSDAGTLFEVGWARKHGVPVVGLAECLDPEAEKMLGGTDVVLLDDLSAAVYRALWVSMGAPASL